MIALLGALQNELSGVAKSMTIDRHIAGKPWHIAQGSFAGKDILLVRTGMGKDCALSTTEYILENYPVTVMISFGFAGALEANLKVGDVVLCQKLYCESSATDGTVYLSDGSLLALAVQSARDKTYSPIIGDCLTVDLLTASSEKKHAQAKAFGTQVVEMESYWVASLAAARKVPFLAVRAISDALEDRLPPFDRFMNSDGEWLVMDALRYFLSTPGDLAMLPRIYRRSQLALRNLTALLTLLVPLLPGEMQRINSHD